MTDRPDLALIKVRLIWSEDEDFIAHAPEDIAALLAEVERLRANPLQDIRTVELPGLLDDFYPDDEDDAEADAFLPADALNSMYNDEKNRLRWKHDGQLVSLCERCNVQWYNTWDVPDDEWNAGRHDYNELCRPCFDLLAARVEIARLRAVAEAAKDVAENTVLDADARLPYVVVQPDRSEWQALLQAIEAWTDD
jgi:hypothetical protein